MLIRCSSFKSNLAQELIYILCLLCEGFSIIHSVFCCCCQQTTVIVKFLSKDFVCHLECCCDRPSAATAAHFRSISVRYRIVASLCFWRSCGCGSHLELDWLLQLINCFLHVSWYVLYLTSIDRVGVIYRVFFVFKVTCSLKSYLFHSCYYIHHFLFT